MIRPDGYIKVLDFGLMKLMPSDDVTDLTATEPGRVMGTPHYMSPEQARGMETDPSTDVWSVGVLMYEMLAGRPPFSGPSSADVIAAILQDEPTPVVVHSPQMPEPLAQIVATALRKDSAQRYRSAVELHASLATVLSHLDTGIPIPAPSRRGRQASHRRSRPRAQRDRRCVRPRDRRTRPDAVDIRRTWLRQDDARRGRAAGAPRRRQSLPGRTRSLLRAARRRRSVPPGPRKPRQPDLRGWPWRSGADQDYRPGLVLAGGVGRL